MKVAVTGGAGRMALAAIYDFIENDDVIRVLLMDTDSEALEARRNLLNSDKVITQQVDILDHKSLVKTLDDYDVVLNASSHVYNLPVMEACVESRTNYTDLGGLFHWARKQMEKHDEFRETGITGIVGSGSAPGIVNVMARYAYDRLDKVDSVRILDGIVNFGVKGYEFVPPYALDTILDEFSVNNFEFKDGDWVELLPFSGEEVVNFPDPVGKLTVYNMIHSEVATIPVSFADKGIKNVSFKLALPKLFEERLRVLVNMGFAGREPIEVKGVEVAPRDFICTLIEKTVKPKMSAKQQNHDDHKVLRVIVEGEKSGRKQTYTLEAMIHPYEKWNMAMGPFSVGFPAAVTTRLLGGGRITKKGFFASETGIEPQVYFNELAKRGIKVYSQLTEVL